MSLPPSDYAYRLALLRTWGDYHQAAHLLESLNRVQRAFGYPDYDMPEPLRTDLPDLVTCPARQPTLIRRTAIGRRSRLNAVAQ
jgi:hypothetical protein